MALLRLQNTRPHILHFLVEIGIRRRVALCAFQEGTLVGEAQELLLIVIEQFDAIGNRRDWWSEADAARYTAKADAIAKQYDAYSPLPQMNINGRATLGENIADFGGLRVAYLGLQKAGAKNKKVLEPINGLTAPQRFFLNYAQAWRQNIREAELRRRILTDSHSPAKFRVLGPLGNLPEFQQAFSCKAGAKMLRAAGDTVTIW